LLGFLKRTFLISLLDVCFDLGLRLAVGAQFFLQQVKDQNGQVPSELD